MFTRSRILVAAVLALAGVTLAVVLLRPAGPATGRDPVTDLPLDEAVRADLKRQLEEDGAREAAQGGPPYTLPQDQRAGWIAAWNKIRDCAIAHGFDGVPAVAPSYGDGATPSPVIFGSGPVADAALNACPFDESLFDSGKVQAAIAQQGQQRGPAG